ncbi:hypothetical protein HYPSUDRAFT_36298 [Hypholoma sublateritium FD-334 SS-4]|uniref:Uncharacterized protein n=1 Tax=Hypholoma sublateritium (strain FD-334 SS-4) TaxID=945553 RepID=A0A0D2PDF2_HYPSF|nr:hypothetical protein HYPSUDRAFT_36298 [Hypholoma sublateritium FD-334 SS-4]
MQFILLLVLAIGAPFLAVRSTPAPLNTRAAGIVTLAEMKTWVDAQDPTKITLLGDPFAARRNPLHQRDTADMVTVTFCSNSSDTPAAACSPPCTTITAGTACINAPGTTCLFATGQVSFCDETFCSGSCHVFDTCGTALQNGFCATPGTASIGIGLNA